MRSGCLRKYRKTKLPYRPVGEPVNQGFGIRAVILPLVCAMAVAACGTVPDGPSEGAALSPVSAPASKDPVGQREYLANPGPVYDLSGETLFAADSRRDESRFFFTVPELDPSATEDPESEGYSYRTFKRQTASVINVAELLFGSPKVRDTKAGRVGRTVLSYIQVPYTYAATSMD